MCIRDSKISNNLYKNQHENNLKLPDGCLSFCLLQIFPCNDFSFLSPSSVQKIVALEVNTQGNFHLTWIVSYFIRFILHPQLSQHHLLRDAFYCVRHFPSWRMGLYSFQFPVIHIFWAFTTSPAFLWPSSNSHLLIYLHISHFWFWGSTTLHLHNR